MLLISQDIQNNSTPHHDSLVVTTNIGSYNARRILVDGGSSVNVIMARTLKKMGIPLDQIVTESTVLVGFSEETKDTLGEISLPTSAQSVPSIEKVMCYGLSFIL